MKKSIRKCRIADAMNTYKYALSIINDKGYKLFLIPDTREEYLGDYWAIKDDRDFIAQDPLRLLSLITIWENFGDNWQKARNEIDMNLDDRILSRALPDSVLDYEELSQDEFASFVNDYKVLFHAIDYPITLKDNISRQEMFEIIDNYGNE